MAENTTGWSEIVTAAKLIIDDVRWQDEIESDPARFFRAKSDYVSLALPLLARPPELLAYLQKDLTEPKYADYAWTSDGNSTTAQTVIQTQKIGYELFSAVLRSSDGTGAAAYPDAVYDPVTGTVTMPVQPQTQLEYEFDFYTDGTFQKLTHSMKRLFALAVAVVWDERFDRDWLADTMKIQDSSFKTVNESNYIEKTSERLKKNRTQLNAELWQYEQNCVYAENVPQNHKITKLL